LVPAFDCLPLLTLLSSEDGRQMLAVGAATDKTTSCDCYRDHVLLSACEGDEKNWLVAADGYLARF
jgi:hypothetical protein